MPVVRRSIRCALGNTICEYNAFIGSCRVLTLKLRSMPCTRKHASRNSRGRLEIDEIPEMGEAGSAAGQSPSWFVVRRHIFSLLSLTALSSFTQPDSLPSHSDNRVYIFGHATPSIYLGKYTSMAFNFKSSYHYDFLIATLKLNLSFHISSKRLPHSQTAPEYHTFRRFNIINCPVKSPLTKKYRRWQHQHWLNRRHRRRRVHPFLGVLRLRHLQNTVLLVSPGFFPIRPHSRRVNIMLGPLR